MSVRVRMLYISVPMLMRMRIAVSHRILRHNYSTNNHNNKRYVELNLRSFAKYNKAEPYPKKWSDRVKRARLSRA